MNLLLVTFALRDPNMDYSQFFVALRGNSQQWWHFIEQTCVVTTFHDPGSLSNSLLPYILPTDSLLIVKIEPYRFEGWLPRAAWDWLHRASSESSASRLRGLSPIPGGGAG